MCIRDRNISMQVTVFQVVHALGLYDTLAAPIILYIGVYRIALQQVLVELSSAVDIER